MICSYKKQSTADQNLILSSLDNLASKFPQINVNLSVDLKLFFSNLKDFLISLDVVIFDLNSIINKDTVSVFNVNFDNSFTLINFFFNFFTIFYFLLLSLLILLKSRNFLNTLFLSKILYESEKELNSFDDLIVILTLIIFFFFYVSGLYFLFYFYNYMYIYFYILSFVLLFTTIIGIPLLLLYEYGFYFNVFLRGSSNSLNFLYELLLDYINIISYILRICVQFVRIIIILITLFTYNEVFLELNFASLTSFNNATNFLDNLTFNNLRFITHLLFELSHLIIIFCAQFMTFSIMIL